LEFSEVDTDLGESKKDNDDNDDDDSDDKDEDESDTEGKLVTEEEANQQNDPEANPEV